MPSRSAPRHRPGANPVDFDANTFPLDPGLRLLEASAGTGKTFALAHLALRLVTERAIPLRRLLVVTFTDAAATELRERIGRRLQEALISDPVAPAGVVPLWDTPWHHPLWRQRQLQALEAPERIDRHGQLVAGTELAAPGAAVQSVRLADFSKVAAGSNQ
jgi:hypothetical protein